MSGAELIAAERQRQIDVEGWTPEHDDSHADDGALAKAAAVYATPADHRATTYHVEQGESYTLPTLWPWARVYYKPTPDDRVRELVKAGALIAAEIDRLQRASVQQEDKQQ